MLNISIVLNGVQRKVKSHHVAITSAMKEVKMNIGRYAGLSHVDTRKGTYKVRSTRLDKLIKEDIFLLKIDVEVRLGVFFFFSKFFANYWIVGRDLKVK